MISQLIRKIREKGAPIVVGLDPKLEYIPERLLTQAFAANGETPEAAAAVLTAFNQEIVDHVCDLVPAVKPQIAMYEQFGIAGMLAFQRTVDYCHEKGLLVIGDIKRGDIGSTSESYAIGHLGRARIGTRRCEGFHEDFATVNPYLGSDGVLPFVKVCREEDKGIFVLVKTSNPGSGEFQDRVFDGKTLYELVAEKVEAWGKDCMDGAYSNVGAVVGATYPEVGMRLRKIMPHAYFLVPGYGAQGGTGAELAPFFDEDGLGAIVNSSRGIIAAWREERYASYGALRFGEAARAAVLDMKEDIARALEKR